MKLRNILYYAILFSFVTANAQTVNYNGLGRGYVTDDSFKGNLIDKDSISPSSGTGGYFLFDLGLNINPSDALKAQAILRSKMAFGGFFGDGANFEFRQFKISGILGKGTRGVKYELGDLDLELSPYTLFNFSESFNEYESDIFANRRSITHYENFNFGNAWRTQGANVETRLKFEQIVESADIKLFATRTKRALDFLQPDRFIVGSKLGVTQSENLLINANFIHFFDASTTSNTVADKYSNTVLTGELNYNRELDGGKILFDLESGLSDFSFNEVSSSKKVSLSDYFFDSEIAYELTKLNMKVGLGYRYVGFDFLSAGSQTRRVYDYGVPSVFGSINENSGFRNPSLFDRYSQEAIYNQTLSPTLMMYNPRYNLVSPYGNATPNRKGISLNVSSIDSKKWYEYKVNLQLLNEVVGEGVVDLRNFTSLAVGSKLKVGDLLKYKKDLNVILGARQENSKRQDDLVDFSTTSFDLGVDVEFFKDFYLQGGVKYILSSGNEYIAQRDQFNEITSYEAFNLNSNNSDITENVVSIGTKYEFGKYSVFSFNAHFMNLNNTNNSEVNYSINEYFFGYTLKF